MKGLEDIGSGFTQSVKGKYHNILSKGVTSGTLLILCIK